MAAEQKGDGPELKAEQERERIARAVESGDMAERDGDLLLEFLDAIDPDDYNTQPQPLDGTKSYSTIYAYGQNMRLLAKAADTPLAELTAAGLNDVFSGMDVKQNTVSQRQAAARMFYRYHAGLGVDPELITIDRPERSPVQPRDLYVRDEIDAIHEAIEHSRDRAMIDLMLYTGQRIRAIQTLKVGDIHLDDSRFYLNTEAAGLKGAKGMRPLLVAQGACQTWMDNHPASDDPEAYFITKLPNAASGDPYTPLHQSTINRRIEKVTKEAGIDRWQERGHAHNFRHTFVRWAYISRDMDIPTIKYMTGHSKDSQTLERTYMNIFESDFAAKAEEAAGVAEKEPEDHLTPEVCPICDYGPLPKDARACPRCTNVLTPDGAQQRNTMQEQAESLIPDVETEAEARAVRAVLAELRENPGDAVNE